MKKILDAAHNNRNTVEACTQRMDCLADAARLLGQTSLAERLNDLSDRLNHSAEKVVTAMAEDLADHVQNTEQSTKNMIAASLLACMEPAHDQP